MGGPKALLTARDGLTFLETVLVGMEAAEPELLLAVVGPWWSGAERCRGTTVVRNPDPDRGPISSIRCGMAFAGIEWSGLMVALVDHPGVRRETYRILSLAHRAHPESIILPTVAGEEGRRGHPVVFPRWTFEDLLGPLADRDGARAVVRQGGSRIREVVVEDPGVLMDLDTRERYRTYLKETGKA